VLSLCIVMLTKITDSGVVEKIFLELLELEEYHFITGFHRQVHKVREKA
jgi:hypothetical protein